MLLWTIEIFYTKPVDKGYTKTLRRYTIICYLVTVNLSDHPYSDVPLTIS